MKDIEGTGKELVQMYLAAQKYEVEGLRKLVLQKLETNIHPRTRSDNFLGVVMEIAAACPQSDTLLHDFLQRTFCDVLGGADPHTSSTSLADDAKAKIQTIIRGGGQLALDVHEAQLSLDASKAKQAKEAAAKAKWKIEDLSGIAQQWKERSDAWADHHEYEHSDDCEFAPR